MSGEDWKKGQLRGFLVGWFLLVAGLIGAVIHIGKDTDTGLLFFAAVVLSGFGLIFVLAIGLYYFSPEEAGAGAKIFDAAKTIIPPFLAMVLGYYFGQGGEFQDRPSENNTGIETSQKNGT